MKVPRVTSEFFFAFVFLSLLSTTLHMGFNLERIVEVLSVAFTGSHSYEMMIDPIIIGRDRSGAFDGDALLNRLAYTIIDQQRDVERFIIPIWTTLMLMNVNPVFLREHPAAGLIVKSVLKAYGHQQYHTKHDLKVINKRIGSRTDAFIGVYKKYTPQEFVDVVEDNKDDIEALYKILQGLNFISKKSATFFLRDIEGIEFNLLPVDVNVAYSTQYTGILFHECLENKGAGAVDFSCIKGRIIPVSKRTGGKNYHSISDAVKDAALEAGENPYQLNRFLFLLGADYCHSLGCETCPVRDYCLYNSELNESQKKVFNAALRAGGVGR
ncbi:MAG: hypothetical protein ACTSU9_19780 [Promethearchaeota archaeon]